IQRADEITELLSIYWSDEFGGKRPICNQIKSGIKRAFHKFDEYQFAKYNRKQKAIWLRDVMNLTHPKPNSKNEDIFKRLINDELKTPDTWEVNLSAGKNKKETFKRMIKEKKLPYMALLRNLRNMMEAKVDEKLIKEALIDGAERSRALPFRFIAAAKCGSKHLESTIDKAMLMSLKNREKIDGSTIILVDVSGSMVAPLSRNSYMYRLDAAFGLAILSREVFSDCKVYSFSWELADVPDRRGIALADAISKSQSNMGTNLGSALNKLKKKHPNYKRYIVITDEQSHDRVSSPNCERGYLINVAPYQVGVGYDNNWIHIDGFSEATIDFIVEYEKEFMDS
ncbi:MAG: TROVE domain-containing protein, partial [archaeon]